MTQFVVRLKKMVVGCQYGADEDNQIRDQVVQHCISDWLRRKLLEKGEGLTLQQVMHITTNLESVGA